MIGHIAIPFTMAFNSNRVLIFIVVAFFSCNCRPISIGAAFFIFTVASFKGGIVSGQNHNSVLHQ